MTNGEELRPEQSVLSRRTSGEQCYSFRSRWTTNTLHYILHYSELLRCVCWDNRIISYERIL